MSIHPLSPAEPPLSLGFLSPHNPYDRRAFSGTAFFAARALERRPRVALTILGHRPPGPLSRVLGARAPAIDKSRIAPGRLDAVVGMVATGLLDGMIRDHPDCPVLHVTDATPGFLRDAYGWRIEAGADAAETRVAEGAVRTIYSSSEIAARAPGDLALPDLRPDVVPFGVNFDHLPVTNPRKPSLNRLNLLFVGLDWERKGGDIAVATLDRLRAMDWDAHLTVVGRCPERHRDHPAITSEGFLNKNRPRDADRLACLYMQAHLLLLPSRADCTPMVVAEAMAHGTPVIASETGGVRSLVGPGTGALLPAFASPADWAEAIKRVTGEADAYTMLSDAAFDRAGQMTWDKWAERVETLARQALRVPSRFERVLKAAVQA